jgi:hypothetical protein
MPDSTHRGTPNALWTETTKGFWQFYGRSFLGSTSQALRLGRRLFLPPTDLAGVTEQRRGRVGCDVPLLD